ncbi:MULTISPECIES: hydrogenase maturation factor HybG [Yersinia]|jgi:hydrogenase expression/formation protein HypC|uniref:hydrogenase maturation factor HybG n=1 Tax=Yersinia TaxID=629 RepID=UPI0005AC316A|nr:MULTISPECIES: hydrogenase maturation factor HybG [Yersinia]AJJ20718.1 hydrogenase assembly chaperone HypC/HupF [Yersinia intermedia]ARB86488.1 HypC/HybG/HupF family hydrogenase formation chaperone [Yersinia sp. FDAARGOS_228]AVL36348.1 HypC/HybG/HupF family hydrogenase formation chaperone [Yersinia intermedia]MCW8113389.1 hydrogenase maturation factor HybG [Yersinia intermedia]MDA5482277.1 hydrogenase maturation factor HybG [Yersinia intermedia]
MCIGVPGKIVAVGEDIHQLAWVEVSGVKREINIALICDDTPAALLGQWVLVHVGFAMSLLDEEEAQQTLVALEHMQAVGLDWDATAVSEARDALR